METEIEKGKLRNNKTDGNIGEKLGIIPADGMSLTGPAVNGNVKDTKKEANSHKILSPFVKLYPLKYSEGVVLMKNNYEKDSNMLCMKVKEGLQATCKSNSKNKHGKSESKATKEVNKPCGSGKSESNVAKKKTNPSGSGKSESNVAKNMTNPSGSGKSESNVAKEITKPSGDGKSESNVAKEITKPSGSGKSESNVAKEITNPSGSEKSESNVAKEITKPSGDGKSESNVAKEITNPCGSGKSESNVAKEVTNQSETNEKPYRCQLSYCKKQFLTKVDCDRHLYTHCGLKPVICKLCNKEFISIKGFERHQCRINKNIVQKCTGFLCETCGKAFNQQGTLIGHKRSHEKVKPYSCRICKRKFVLKATLHSHVLTHSEASTKPKGNDTLVLKAKLQNQVFSSALCSPPQHEGPCNGLHACIQTSEENADKMQNDCTKLDCIVCKESFDNVQSFIQHVNDHKNNGGNTKLHSKQQNAINQKVKTKTIALCTCCGKKFASVNYAQNHLFYCYQRQGVAEKMDALHKEFIDLIKTDLDFDIKKLTEKFISSVPKGNIGENLPATSTSTVVHHCTECNKSFQSKDDLYDHLGQECPHEHRNSEEDHQSTEPLDLSVSNKRKEQNYVCRKCKEICPTLQEFIKHKASKHSQKTTVDSENVSYLCDPCQMEFSSQALLYKHLANVHMKEGRKKQGKNSTYDDKMIRDTLTGQWVCALCNKSLSNRSNLIRHITLHDQQQKANHNCPFCECVFHYRRYLQHHIMYKHRSEHEKKNVCDICESRFTTKGSLRRHKKLHTGEFDDKRVVQCTICEKKFTCNEHLNSHMQIHTGEKRFQCDRCDYQGSSYFNLQRHLTSHEHKESKWKRKNETCSNIENSKKRKKEEKGEV